MKLLRDEKKCHRVERAIPSKSHLRKNAIEFSQGVVAFLAFGVVPLPLPLTDHLIL
jgi:hypothetical protein